MTARRPSSPLQNFNVASAVGEGVERLTKEQILAKYYGYQSFRPRQAEIIDALLSSRELLAILPTGAGKSICFQVPALMLPRYTLVVSPLISLMRDQVLHLKQRGIAAASVDSSSLDRGRQALRDVAAGRLKLIYVAPERLLNEAFLRLARRLPPSAVIVDEAHTAEWARSFRPSYRSIRTFVEALPERPRFAAFTATATPAARKFIINTLGLRSPRVIVGSFDRPNLTFFKYSPPNKNRALLTELERRRGECAIVYCATRRIVQDVTQLLRAHGFDAVRYHAGLTNGERSQARERFISGAPLVVVATNAFGMGIDRPDVRLVVHYNMPSSPESYYQEAGRAGRDGKPAACILFYSQQDLELNRSLLEQSARLAAKQREGRKDFAASQDSATANTLLSAANYYAMDESFAALSSMWSYANTQECMRSFLLRYFGESPTFERCGNCSNCSGGSSLISKLWQLLGI